MTSLRSLSHTITASGHAPPSFNLSTLLSPLSSDSCLSVVAFISGLLELTASQSVQLRQLAAALQASESEVKEAHSQISVLSNSKAKLDHLLSRAEVDISALKREVQSLESTRAELQTQQAALRGSIALVKAAAGRETRRHQSANELLVRRLQASADILPSTRGFRLVQPAATPALPTAAVRETALRSLSQDSEALKARLAAVLNYVADVQLAVEAVSAAELQVELLLLGQSYAEPGVEAIVSAVGACVLGLNRRILEAEGDGQGHVLAADEENQGEGEGETGPLRHPGLPRVSRVMRRSQLPASSTPPSPPPPPPPPPPQQQQPKTVRKPSPKRVHLARKSGTTTRTVPPSPLSRVLAVRRPTAGRQSSSSSYLARNSVDAAPSRSSVKADYVPFGKAGQSLASGTRLGASSALGDLPLTVEELGGSDKENF